MKYNPIAFMSPIQSHADFAERVAMVRQAEREAGTKYPNTTEAIMLEFEGFVAAPGWWQRVVDAHANGDRLPEFPMHEDILK